MADNPENRPFTHEEEEMLRIMTDPVEWVTYHSNQEPRWYQKQILRHPHHRRVLRCGRRIGKCIAGDQRILDPDTGMYTEIRDLYANTQTSRVPTLGGTYKQEEQQAVQITANGDKDTYRITTDKGASVVLTGNHPVLTIDGWKEVDLLEEGERIATPKHLSYFGDTHVDHAEAVMVAFLLWTGRQSGDHFFVQASSPEAVTLLQQASESLNYNCVLRHGRQETYMLTPRDEQRRVHALFEQVPNPDGERYLPAHIFAWDDASMSAFVATIVTIAGWFHTGKPNSINVSSSHGQLIRDFRHLMLRYGVVSTIHSRNESRYTEEDTIYQLAVYNSEDHRRFFTSFDMFVPSSASYRAFKEAVDSVSTYEPTIPRPIWDYIEEKRTNQGLSKAKVAGQKGARLRTHRSIPESKLDMYGKNLGDTFLQDLADSDVYWDEVVSITDGGVRDTYDVMVPETHNLVVEDIYVHNTWTMVAHMLWIAFTANMGRELDRGAVCLVATPYNTQAQLIFDDLNSFIENSPALRSSVKSTTKSPFRIDFHNGSSIKLFTAGTNSGGQGGALRGQRASYLYLDRNACKVAS